MVVPRIPHSWFEREIKIAEAVRAQDEYVEEQKNMFLAQHQALLDVTSKIQKESFAEKLKIELKISYGRLQAIGSVVVLL